MGGLIGYFRGKEPTPIKGILPRLQNIAINNYKGLIGFGVPLFTLTWNGKEGDNANTITLIYLWMFWSHIWLPVAPQVVGFIPMFIFPVSGVMSSSATLSGYFTEGVTLFLLGGMVHLLLNNSGFDRRMCLWFLCSGDDCQFSAKRLVFKSSVAAYVLSMFSNRLIVTSTLTQYITPVMATMKDYVGRSSTEPDFNELRNIINNAIHTSSTIGSITIVHASFNVLAFRCLFYASAPKDKEYPDIFNYLQYTAFALPVSFVMIFLNISYHMILLNFVAKPMSNGTMAQVKYNMLKNKNDIPKKITCHEQLTIFCLLVALAIFFTRWCPWLNMGWATFSKDTESPTVPKVRDATVAAIFTVLLHSIPRGYGFVKIILASKKSELPNIKQESSILFWRFVNKNTVYSYIILIGSGVAVYRALVNTGLHQTIGDKMHKQFSSTSWHQMTLLITVVAVAMANVMTSVAAITMCLPFILCLNTSSTPEPAGRQLNQEFWEKKMYSAAIAVGLGTSLSFMRPHVFTPAYFCHYSGKVPMHKMMIYSILPIIMCIVIIWAACTWYAPMIWDPEGAGVLPVAAPQDGVAEADSTTTTAAPP